MNYNTIATDEVLAATKTALEQNGFTVLIVENGEEAKQKALEMIPEGSEVFTMTSMTNDTIGLSAILNESGKYDSVRAKFATMDMKTQGREMRKLGAGPDIATGSVHAVTQDGKVVIASNTGSQLPAYAYGAGKVIWIVGAQKVTKDLEDAMKRIYEYVLPLESERAHIAYGVPASAVNKLLIINHENQAGRLTVILVKEQLGF